LEGSEQRVFLTSVVADHGLSRPSTFCDTRDAKGCYWRTHVMLGGDHIQLSCIFVRLKILALTWVFFSLWVSPCHS
jgi:hypothetical protein